MNVPSDAYCPADAPTCQEASTLATPARTGPVVAVAPAGKAASAMNPARPSILSSILTIRIRGKHSRGADGLACLVSPLPIACEPRSATGEAENHDIIGLGRAADGRPPAATAIAVPSAPGLPRISATTRLFATITLEPVASL